MCFLVLPVLLLGSWTGVGQVPAASALSLEQARSDFYAVMDATEELIGGDWDNQDDSESRGCLLADGTAGRTYSALRLALPSAVAVIAPVTAAWEDAGYTVERASIGPVTQLIASAGAHELLIFRVSDRAMTLQGESECRPASSR